MALKYGKKKTKLNSAFYTIVTVLLVSAVFLGMIEYLYVTAEEEAYENLHVQTKQIKDNIVLQLLSDRENLVTMANFAAKLHRDGEDYDLMFESFKSIGLIENIGILNPDNTFVTKAGSVDLDGLISFDEEKERGSYISGRVGDLTRRDFDIVRSATPIVVGHDTVGILYGVIKLDKINERYSTMAKEFDAQLFVYGKEDGNLVIDTVHEELGNISFLKDRKYHEGYSFEQIMSTEKGFSSFESVYRDENIYLHYSTIEELGWVIAMGRYDSQVFAATRKLTNVLLIVFFIVLFLMALYVILLVRREKRHNLVTACASEVRRTLLETTENRNNIEDALKLVCEFAKSRSAIFFDTDGEFHRYVAPGHEEIMFSEKGKTYFRTEFCKYATEFNKFNGNAVNVFCIKPNEHLVQTNPFFYSFLQGHDIKEISFSATVIDADHITILAAVNSKRGVLARQLAEKISACFSMALHNKNNLSKTLLVATTDSLTGTLNRVSYKSDLAVMDAEQPGDFSCIYFDVNELHLCNNKYGHAAGDEMLLNIANMLKGVFYGHKIYRIGGDEFLVFCKNTDPAEVNKTIDLFNEQLRTQNYHVAIGMSYREKNTDTGEMVREAEVRMYEAKAKYYQNKGQQNPIPATEKEYTWVKTGIPEIDTLLPVLKSNYTGIYRVSLENDEVKRILMPSYFRYNEIEQEFSKLYSKYVAETVDPDYHRAVLSFLNYEALRNQLTENKIPKITYKKNNGEIVVLSVHRLSDAEENVFDTLWVFEKKQK